jgi:hypothetical protein
MILQSNIPGGKENHGNLKVTDVSVELHPHHFPHSSDALQQSSACFTFISYCVIADSIQKHEHMWHLALLHCIGGLGGFGLELADWLVLRGARKLVLSSRSGVKTGYQSFCVSRWRSYGATVVITLADITTESGIRALLSQANRLGQVDAIFNLAMVSIMLVHIYKAHDC